MTFFFAIGRAKHPSKDATVKASVTAGQARVDNKIEGKLGWDFLFTPLNIPAFMQIDQFRTLATLIASVSSGIKIDVDHATFTPAVGFGGADVRWESTQLINKYLDSIEATNYALDEGPEVEYSTNTELAQIYFSLKNVALKKMRIAAMALDVVYTELDFRESGFCGVIINQIDFDEDYKPTTDDVNRDVETLENKLRTEFADIFKEFVKKTIAKRS